MNGGAVFSGSRGLVLVIVGGTAFIAILLAQIFGDRLGISQSFGPDPSSVSAIGTRGFLRMLDRLAIAVVMTAPGGREELEPDAVLVITDPVRALATRERRAETLGGIARAIVVLPKWAGEAASPDRRWIGPVRRTGAARELWRTLADDGAVRAVDEVGEPRITFDGLAPSLPAPQLVTGEAVRPLVSYDGGVLIGELLFQNEGLETVMIVVADPDLVANYNIAAGDNAALAVRMVEEIAPPGATLAFLAPAASAGSAFWQRAFTFPHGLLTLQVGLALAIVIWAGMGRFGGPMRAPPPLGAGREQLIANAAGLLDHARHGAAVLEGYARAMVHDVARAMKAPRGLGEAELLDWLDDMAMRRGKPAGAAALFARAVSSGRDRHRTTGGIVRAGLALHRWKREMTDDT